MSDNVIRKIRAALRRRTIRSFNKAHLVVLRLTRGRMFNTVIGMPVLVLTTTGRKSGLVRTTPLTYFRDGDDYCLIASNGGSDRAPAWSYNLQANPSAVIETEGRKLVVQAKTASGDERERLWTAITAAHPTYARYQAKTSRRIPVIVLTERTG